MALPRLSVHFDTSAEPLRKRAPSHDEHGKPLCDFMMLIPGLRDKPKYMIDNTIQDIHIVLTHFNHAVVFAETGHLCLATLHANNANQALDRIINFFPEERKRQLLMDLSLNMRAFVAQQLIPTPDGKGRRAAVEIMINSPLMSDYIREGEIHKLKEIIKKSREEGMQTFDQALYDLYRAEAITYEDALHHADSPNDLRLMIKLGDEEASESMGSSLEGVSFTDTRDEQGSGFGSMGHR